MSDHFMLGVVEAGSTHYKRMRIHERFLSRATRYLNPSMEAEHLSRTTPTSGIGFMVCGVIESIAPLPGTPEYQPAEPHAQRTA